MTTTAEHTLTTTLAVSTHVASRLPQYVALAACSCGNWSHASRNVTRENAVSEFSRHYARRNEVA